MTPRALEHPAADSVQTTPISHSAAKALSAAALVAALSACGGGSDGDGNNNQPPQGGGDTPTQPTPQPQPPEPEWQYPEVKQTVSLADILAAQQLATVLSSTNQSVSLVLGVNGYAVTVTSKAQKVDPKTGELTATDAIVCDTQVNSSGNYASVITVNPNVHAEETDVCIFEQKVEDVAARTTTTTDWTVKDIIVDTESPRAKMPSVFSGETSKAGYINLPNILQPVDGADGKGAVTYTIETPTAGWSLNTPALTSAKGENVLEYYFVNPGTYTVTVDVTDKAGNPTPVVIAVNVAAPSPVVTPPTTPQCPGGTQYFDGVCS